MTVTVLYQTYARADDRLQSSSALDVNGFNCFELSQVKASNTVLLYDILYHISNNTTLSNLLNHQYQYYVSHQDQLVHLPSPSSVVPVSSDGIVVLKLFPGISPLVSKNQLLQFQQTSKDIFAPPVPSSSYSQNQPRRVERQPSRSSRPDFDFDQPVDNEFASQQRHPPATNAHNQTNSASYGVGDLQEAAEVAKEAARSLFSFAANVGKSVIDVASNLATTTTAAASGGGVGGIIPGATITVGRTRVLVVRQLSEGGFGIVYIVRNEQGKSLALKQLICQSKEQVEEAHNEIDALLMCQSNPYVVPLLDHSSTLLGHGNSGPRQVLMLFPLYPRGTAWEAMERSGVTQDPATARSIPWPFPEAKAIAIIHSIASALAFLHEKGYAHRDVKPHNVLLADEEEAPVGGGRRPPVAVLMDFGSVSPAVIHVNSRQEALRVEDEAATKTSAAYRSPELTTAPLPPFTIDERVDTWGLGCTMYCLAFGRSPFETPKEGISRLAIMNGKYTVPADRQHRNCRYSEAYIQLIQRMLNLDINARPSMQEIISLCEKWKI
eukprot:gene8144-8808_t